MKQGISRVFIWITAVFLFTAVLTGCDEKNFSVVVSDGITNSDLRRSSGEILPNATVFYIEDEDKGSLIRHLTAGRIEDAHVSFHAMFEGEWIPLGEGETDKNGRVSLSALRTVLPPEVLNAAPVDLPLRATVTYRDRSIEDTEGLLRILSADSSRNPALIITDHDNTLHRTGGTNSVADWIEFVNWASSDWPLVDDYVAEAVKGFIADGNHMIVVSGLPSEIRYLCREQMKNHFETETTRQIPMVIKKDLPYEHSNEFKTAAIGIIKDLYGEENVIAMVGDTADEDGYGALANNIPYVPFQVDYYLDNSLLDTNGYGTIDIKSIAWDWLDVLKTAFGLDSRDNFFLQEHPRVLNIAHRGGGALMPENTLEAYRNAISKGADVLEMDLHMTSDGHVVVSHDSTVDRCTDGTGSISEKTLKEIKALDAGYRFTPDEEQFPYRGRGLKIPTFEEVLTEFGETGTPLVVEIKAAGNTEIIDKTLGLIEKYGAENNVVMGAFDKTPLDAIRIRAAARQLDIVTSFCTDEVIEFIAMPEEVQRLNKHKPKGKLLQIPLKEIPLIQEYIMDKSGELDLRVQVWTINDAEDMRWLIEEMQVDGIMTDNPELLESVLEATPYDRR